MYGAGLRVVEAARLRIKDVDFDKKIITIHDGKGAKDRTTLLPASLIAPLLERREHMFNAWKQQDSFYYPPVSLPFALRRKYPNAGHSFEWQWLFPSTGLCINEDGQIVRHHFHVSAIQKAVRQAVRQSNLNKPASYHTFRHSFATELLRRGRNATWALRCAYNADIYSCAGSGICGCGQPDWMKFMLLDVSVLFSSCIHTARVQH